ncbi:hypothetical protein ANN_01236 [Periplaneta americana]|uniref:Uncharacterized protein n=1 Tax=Periplaneta americana TaxID=6978 RepID=A0ABQ8TT19_PERAM|nr:hypothetical protein ANN_01236 [Periplaneta americana]
MGRSLEGLNPEIEVGNTQHFLFVPSISGSSSFSAWTCLNAAGVIDDLERLERSERLVSWNRVVRRLERACKTGAGAVRHGLRAATRGSQMLTDSAARGPNLCLGGDKDRAPGGD